MRVRQLLLVSAVVVLVAVFVRPHGLDACGPTYYRPLFVLRDRPDVPGQAFAAGGLGRVRPTWARRYLVVAYRHLSGRPLTGEERDQWGPGSGPAPGIVDVDVDAAIRLWLDARLAAGAPALPPNISAYRPVAPGRYDSFLNCPADAFKTAAATLTRRSQEYGPASAALGEWIRSQDMVFSNCRAGGTIPEMLPDTVPPSARRDRAYQVAAAHFYATDFEEAETAFRAIAADRGSAWSEIAPYLAARCLVRRATLGASPGHFDRPLLERAEAELAALRKPSHDPQLAGSIDALLGFVRLRTAPALRAGELATMLASGADGRRWSRALIDYLHLLDRAYEDSPWDPAEARLAKRASGFDRLAALRAGHDLTDWVIAFQASGPEAARHAVERWRDSRSPAWLIAALDKATPGGPEVDELLAAARRVPTRDPAHVTALFHTIRLQVQGGEGQMAVDPIDAVLARRGEWPVSFVNELLGWRLPRARSLEEFARFAPRVPAGGTDDLMGGSGPPVSPWSAAGAGREKEPAADVRWKVAFDVDAAGIVNYGMPLVLLERLAENSALDQWLRREIGLAVWTRAVLGNRDAAARRAFPFVERAAPALAAELASYRSARTATERQAAALLLLLKLPGLRPTIAAGVGRNPYLFETAPRPGAAATLDPLRDNWWCDGGALRGASAYGEGLVKPPPAPWPSFLAPEERAQAGREQEELSRLPAAPVAIGERTVRWARTAPRDARVPEALHLVVRATRFGCWTNETTAVSRAAFRLLHSRYPASEWARKTPYYY